MEAAVNTDCQFCKRDGGAIWRGPFNEAWTGLDSPPGDYWVATGCLARLHTQLYLACGRHLMIFLCSYKQIPCQDCELAPQEISYLGEVIWERRKDHERENGAS